MMESVHLVHWNIRSFFKNKDNLISITYDHSPHIISLSETWIKPGQQIKFPSYSDSSCRRQDGYGGSSILINRNIPFSKINIKLQFPPTIQLSVIKLDNLTIASIYISPNTVLTDNFFDNLFSSLTPPFIIVGDFNCRHSMWGCSTDNTNGFKLFNSINNHLVCILNNATPTRLSNNNISILDIAICSSNIYNYCSFQVLEDTYGSDHFPIKIIYNAPKAITMLAPFKKLSNFNYKKADWTKYRVSFSSNFNYNLDYSSFYESIIKAADLSIPKFKTSPSSSFLKNITCIWWDKDCSKVVRSRRKAFWRFKKSPSFENFQTLKKLINYSKTFLREKKREAWKKFCESLNRYSDIGKIWAQIKQFSKSFLSVKNISSAPLHIIQEFETSLSPCTVEEDDLTFPPFHEEHFLLKPFNFNEMKSVLAFLKDSSPGMDSINYSMIKFLPDYKISELIKIFNSFLKDPDLIPSSWNDVCIIPILKSDKDPIHPKSYRPIALTSCIRKIFEHLLKNRMEWWLENSNLFPISQMGFRKGRGTQDCLSTLTTDILSGFSNMHHTIAIFLDISAAYDNVNIRTLSNVLLSLNIPSPIVKIIYNLCYVKVFNVYYNNSLNSPRIKFSGLPQGSVLSPLLYNIYKFSFVDALPLNVKYLQYADDIVIYQTGQNSESISLSINKALDSILNWLDDHSLSLSTEKTKAMLFSRCRKRPNSYIKINGLNINFSDSVRFLGIELDSKINFKLHFNKVHVQCSKLLNILKYLKGTKWGADPKILLMLYKSLIRSRLEYGSIIFSPANKVGLNRLDCIQSAALRICIGVLKSSPISALQVECNVPPLLCRRKFLANRFLSKILSIRTHPLICNLYQLSNFVNNKNIYRFWIKKPHPLLVSSLNEFIDSGIVNYLNINDNFPIFKYDPFNIFPPIPCVIKENLKSDKHCSDKFYEFVNKNWPHHAHIYTDGSYNPSDSISSFGIFVPKFEISIKGRLPNFCNIFYSELYAIYRSLLFIETHDFKHWIIISDSLSALKSLSKFNKYEASTNELHILIKNKFFSLIRDNYNISLTWSPGHSNIHGNEKADEIAKSVNFDPILQIKLDFKIFTSYFKKLLKSEWQNIYNMNSQSKGKYFKTIQPIVGTSWFYKIPISESSIISKICRLRLNHCNTNEYLFKIGIVDSPFCDCGAIENISHVFWHCSLYTNPRNKLLNILYNQKIPAPFSLQDILTHTHLPIINALNDFLNEIKVNI